MAIRSPSLSSNEHSFPTDHILACDRETSELTGQYKTRTADCGLRTGLGIKRGLSIKYGLSLKIALLSHKPKKNATFSVFPALLSCVPFNYSIPFSNLKYGFENSENYFQIRQQQGTLNLKEGTQFLYREVESGIITRLR